MIRGVSLFWRVFTINTVVLVVGAVALALSPATVSSRIHLNEVVVLAVGVGVVLAVDLVLMRRVFGPLERLSALMRRVDPLTPGQRVELDRPVAEVAELSVAFNEMLDRLELERRESARRALDAQEEERRRMARELHDEIGQTLTGVVLQLETLERTAPESCARRCGRSRRPHVPPSRRSASSCGGCARRRSTTSACAPRSSRSAPSSPSTAACASPRGWPVSCRRSARRTSSSSTGSPRRAS